MKNVIVLILSLFTAMVGYGQMDSLKMISYQISECHNGDGCERELDYRVINSEYCGDTLNLSVKGIANCSGIHNIKVSRFEKEVFINFEEGHLSSADTTEMYIDEITGNTIYSSFFVGWSDDCDCFYDFNFNILGLERDQSYHYYINGKIVLGPIPRWVIEKDSLEMDSVLSLISEIKEVKYHKSPVKYVICKIISKNLGSDYYYQVKVYEEGEYHTKFEFNVYPKNDYQIFYSYNFLELSFEEWRKYREYPQWDEFWEIIDIIKEDRNNAK